jgi:hypothetical protein
MVPRKLCYIQRNPTGVLFSALFGYIGRNPRKGIESDTVVDTINYAAYICCIHAQKGN